MKIHSLCRHRLQRLPQKQKRSNDINRYFFDTPTSDNVRYVSFGIKKRLDSRIFCCGTECNELLGSSRNQTFASGRVRTVLILAPLLTKPECCKIATGCDKTLRQETIHAANSRDCRIRIKQNPQHGWFILIAVTKNYFSKVCEPFANFYR